MEFASWPSVHAHPRPSLMEVFLKFVLVGAIGVALNFLVTAIFRERVKTSQWTANLLGIAVGMTANYILNRTFTFMSDQRIPLEAGKFALVALLAMLINHTLVWTLVTRLNVKFYLAKAITTCVVFLWNFGAHSTYTFDNSPQLSPFFFMA